MSIPEAISRPVAFALAAFAAVAAMGASALRIETSLAPAAPAIGEPFRARTTITFREKPPANEPFLVQGVVFSDADLPDAPVSVSGGEDVLRALPLRAAEGSALVVFANVSTGDPFHPHAYFSLPLLEDEENGAKVWKCMIDSARMEIYAPGEFALPRAAISRRSGNDIFGNPVFSAAAPAPETRIRAALPGKGKPLRPIGYCGRLFQTRVSLDAESCRVGDPLALSVDVKCDRPEQFSPSSLSLGESRLFSMSSEPSEASRDAQGGLHLVYDVQPLEPGAQEFPSIEIAWFDTGAKRYRVLRTNPIPLQVVEAPVAVLRDDFPLPAGFAASVAAGGEPLLPSASSLFLLFALPPLLFAVAALVPRIAGIARSASGRYAAAGALPRALKAIADGSPGAGAEVHRYFSRVHSMNAAAMTSAEARAAMERAGETAEAVETVSGFLAAAEKAAFSRGAPQ